MGPPYLGHPSLATFSACTSPPFHTFPSPHFKVHTYLCCHTPICAPPSLPVLPTPLPIQCPSSHTHFPPHTQLPGPSHACQQPAGVPTHYRLPTCPHLPTLTPQWHLPRIAPRNFPTPLNCPKHRHGDAGCPHWTISATHMPHHTGDFPHTHLTAFTTFYLHCTTHFVGSFRHTLPAYLLFPGSWALLYLTYPACLPYHTPFCPLPHSTPPALVPSPPYGFTLPHLEHLGSPSPSIPPTNCTHTPTSLPMPPTACLPHTWSLHHTYTTPPRATRVLLQLPATTCPAQTDIYIHRFILPLPTARCHQHHTYTTTWYAARRLLPPHTTTTLDCYCTRFAGVVSSYLTGRDGTSPTAAPNLPLRPLAVQPAYLPVALPSSSCYTSTLQIPLGHTFLDTFPYILHTFTITHAVPLRRDHTLHHMPALWFSLPARFFPPYLGYIPTHLVPHTQTPCPAPYTPSASNTCPCWPSYIAHFPAGHMPPSLSALLWTSPHTQVGHFLHCRWVLPTTTPVPRTCLCLPAWALATLTHPTSYRTTLQLVGPHLHSALPHTYLPSACPTTPWLRGHSPGHTLHMVHFWDFGCPGPPPPTQCHLPLLPIFTFGLPHCPHTLPFALSTLHYRFTIHFREPQVTVATPCHTVTPHPCCPAFPFKHLYHTNFGLPGSPYIPHRLWVTYTTAPAYTHTTWTLPITFTCLGHTFTFPHCGLPHTHTLHLGSFTHTHIHYLYTHTTQAFAAPYSLHHPQTPTHTHMDTPLPHPPHHTHGFTHRMLHTHLPLPRCTHTFT